MHTLCALGRRSLFTIVATTIASAAVVVDVVSVQLSEQRDFRTPPEAPEAPNTSSAKIKDAHMQPNMLNAALPSSTTTTTRTCEGQTTQRRRE